MGDIRRNMHVRGSPRPRGISGLAWPETGLALGTSLDVSRGLCPFHVYAHNSLVQRSCISTLVTLSAPARTPTRCTSCWGCVVGTS